jgi:hypothetical protein
VADVQDAIEFMRHASDAESENRASALIDLKFRYGDQWPQYAIASRGLERPQLTINEMDSYIRQVTNMQRQQRPRIKIDPVDDKADVKIAKVITGLTRHIEVNSDADNAYDIAFDFAATIGWGYWRVRTDYIDDDSFNQDIYIDSINNPFGVYLDPNSRLPDGSDGEKALVTDLIPKETFKLMYPGAEAANFNMLTSGGSDPDWVSEQEIRLAEYFYVDRTKANLVMLTDGSIVWDDELPRVQQFMAQMGIKIGIKGERESYKRIVKWCKQTGAEILEEKTLPGKYIPIVPVYWTDVWIDNKRVRQGLVRPAMDSQRMVNFWQTAITESIALAPKAKWLIEEGTDEGHENEFKNANLSANPVLRWKSTNVDGQRAEAPQRLQPEPPPPGAVEASFMASQNLQKVMGIFDPAVRSQEPKSGKAINAERSQAENSNFHGYDNLTRSIKHTGRIILGLIPTIYDTERILRIIGEDGTSELVKVNEQTQAQDETGQAIQKILNDVRVGTYDVVMDTGPGYNTKRIEGVDAMMQLMATPIGEKVAQVGDDLLVRNMDFPGADVLADRLAAANPLSQIDEKLDIPPKVQMMIKSLQAQLQQAQQVMQQQAQEIKFRTGIEQMKQEGETQREHIRAVVKAHDTESWVGMEQQKTLATDKTKRFDTELKSHTALTIEEIKAHLAILLQKMGDSAEDAADSEAIERAV